MFWARLLLRWIWIRNEKGLYKLTNIGRCNVWHRQLSRFFRSLRRGRAWVSRRRFRISRNSGPSLVKEASNWAITDVPKRIFSMLFFEKRNLNRISKFKKSIGRSRNIRIKLNSRLRWRLTRQLPTTLLTILRKSLMKCFSSRSSRALSSTSSTSSKT